MKKVLCLLLSLIMAFSCCAVCVYAQEDTTEPTTDPTASGSTAGFGFDLNQLISDKLGEIDFANALGNFNMGGTELPEEFYDENYQVDMEALLQSGVLNDMNFLGISLDFLYNSDEDLFWVNVPVSKSDLTLAKANLNTYLQRLAKTYFGGNKLYNNRYATALTNFLGHMFYPDYTDKMIRLTTEPCTEDEFYATVVNQSGLAQLVQANWCDQYTLNFKPLIYTLGVDLGDLLDRDYNSGTKIAQEILKAVVQKVTNQGPLSYVLDILWAFSRTYDQYMYEPISALFKLKMDKDYISEDELHTLRGLLNLLFNDNNPADTEHLQFITTPTYRFAISKDSNELFLYFMIYLNLVGKSGNNPTVISNFKTEINNNEYLDDTDKERLGSILDGLMCGDLGNMIVLLGDLFVENIVAGTDGIKQSFKDFLASIINKFAEFIDKIYKFLANIV